MSQEEPVCMKKFGIIRKIGCVEVNVKNVFSVGLVYFFSLNFQNMD